MLTRPDLLTSDQQQSDSGVVRSDHSDSQDLQGDGDVCEPLRELDTERGWNDGGQPAPLARTYIRKSWFMLRKQMSEEEATVEDTKVFPLLKNDQRAETEQQALEEMTSEEMALEESNGLSCGLGRWKPQYLQRFLSKKAYIVVYGILGMSYFALGAYGNATITTIEKRFKIPSRTTGLITSSWDIGVLMSVLAMSYFGMRGHKPHLIAFGSLLVTMSSFLRIMPHLLYGPGQDALELTKEYGDAMAYAGNSSSVPPNGSGLCGSGSREEDCEELGETSIIPAAILLLASIIQGIGSSVYWTLGLTYLDDNTTKDKAPMVHATSQCLRLLGPTIGYAVASYTLSLYVDPTLTPRIDNTDPRWIGGWWIGYAPLGTAVFLLSFMVALFPRQLPRAARRKADRIRRNIEDAPALPKNFFQAFKNLFRNKILVYNSMSAVCFIFGNTSYWIFMPKYMETMYQQTSSRASFISGSIGLASAALGLFVSGFVITRYKPRARYVTGWNVVIEFLDVLCKFGWVFLHCGDRMLQGNWESDGTWNMTSNCNANCECGPDVKYTPVCSLQGDISFYSPCHAGCNFVTEFSNGTKLFTNCTCIPGGVALEGPCVKDCVTNFAIFLVSNCILSFLSASGRAGNILIQFRCVHEDDKPLAIAFSEFLMCALAFIPAPIVVGTLLDTTCLVWGETCGKTGNCWLYDDKKLRYLLNLTGSTLGFAGMLLDAAVCYYSKGLRIYDEEDDEKEEVEVNGRIPIETNK